MTDQGEAHERPLIITAQLNIIILVLCYSQDGSTYYVLGSAPMTHLSITTAFEGRHYSISILSIRKIRHRKISNFPRLYLENPESGWTANGLYPTPLDAIIFLMCVTVTSPFSTKKELPLTSLKAAPRQHLTYQKCVFSTCTVCERSLNSLTLSAVSSFNFLAV
jgi:hypothetical protein